MSLRNAMSAFAAAAAALLTLAGSHCWWMCINAMPGMGRTGVVYRLTGLSCDQATTIGLFTAATFALALAIGLQLWEIAALWKS